MKKFLYFVALIGFQIASAQDDPPPIQNTISYPIYFEYNVGNLDTIEEKRLPFLLRNFDSFDIQRLEITAFCDERGTPKQNDILSKKRAKDIFRKLHPLLEKRDSLNAVLITVEGKGFLPLIGKDNIDEQRSRNRRGDVVIYYSKKPVPVKAKKGRPKIEPKEPEIKLEKFFAVARPGDKMNLKIFFEGGRSTLLASSYSELDTLVSILKQNDTLKINILGHIYANGYAQEIDGYDEDQGNNKLSENRARVVYVYLNKKGINKKRLSYKGLGGQYPTGFSANRDRRVEIEIAGKEEVNSKDSAISK